jgi:hypothetical protein
MSQAVVITFGGIQAPEVQGVRSSERIHAQPNADAIQLERAQQLAQSKDDISPAGNNFISKFSFNSFSYESVVSRASKLGVALGQSPSEVAASVQLLRDIDMQRTLVMLKKGEEKELAKDKYLHSLVISEAKNLSIDLEGEVQEGTEGHKDLISVVPKSKKIKLNRSKEGSSVRRSARLNNGKKSK